MNARNYSAYEVLRDGTQAIVRAIEPADRQNLQEGLARLSTESVYMRFFRVIRKFSQRELEYLTDLDFVNHVAIGVGVSIDGQWRPIAVGRYIAHKPGEDSGTAEVAIVVDDDFQGIGVGSMVLSHLIRIARSNNFVRFKAFVLTSNTRMLRVLANTRLPMQQRTDGDLTEVTLSLETEPGE